MSGILRFFISGKESELDDERAEARKLIETLGYQPIGSEGRPASSDSIESEFLGEVESSDFYIGIFGKIYSEPTIKEFTKARDTGKCTLIFEKYVEDGRDDKLKEFLKKIKDPNSGVVVSRYHNTVDLKNEIIHSISFYISKKYRECKKLKELENVKTTEKLIDANVIDESYSEKIHSFPFTAKFSKDFGKAKFTKFKIISEVVKGKDHIIHARIEGSTRHGFLDLAVKDPEGKYYWFPDPHSYDSTQDNGLLFLENHFYEAQWMFQMPNMSGKYLVLMGLYENKYENREVINFEIQEFMLG